jgi:Trk K+ transport system NAD-binding subunit
MPISSRVTDVSIYTYHHAVLSHELYLCSSADRKGVNTSLTRATIVILHWRTVSPRLLLNAQVVHANVFVIATTGTSNNSRVAKVVVDSNKIRCHTAGANIFNHDLTRTVCTVVGAVTAATVELSRMVTRPLPLCWMTLSLAPVAPPPSMRTSPGPRAVTASAGY